MTIENRHNQLHDSNAHRNTGLDGFEGEHANPMVSCKSFGTQSVCTKVGKSSTVTRTGTLM